MTDNARIGVVRAMIAPAESNPKKQPPILEKAVKTIPWIHQDVNCKNLQEIPLSATEVQCNKCKPKPSLAWSLISWILVPSAFSFRRMVESLMANCLAIYSLVIS